MKCLRIPAFLFGLAALTSDLPAKESISDVFADPALDLKRPADRAKAVAKIKAIEDARAAKTRAKAKALGLEMRTEKPGGGVKEIVDFDGNRPIYLETKNLNAAISTAANLVHVSPYSLNGTGIIAGVWDGGSVRSTHQEFANGSRVTIMDGAAASNHGTHVGGTIGAQGITASAKGMATNVSIASYDWNSDTSEMTSRAATGPNQFDTKIYLSNHSYGYSDGWDGNTWGGNGTDQNAADYSFGQYDATARNLDTLMYSAPYYIAFWAAGNDGSDNPGTGSTVIIGGSSVTYNPAIHPPGDGVYRNGFETIGSHGIAKNLITIGAANDAVTSGTRDPSKSTLTGFSSTGPTDDGRIKPDLVANGASLYSTSSSADNGYTTMSGTSMASPNATGSAVLVVDQYKRLFNSAMRASTLKGLLIHTATDIGNPGPDYKYGWGLINVKSAADLLKRQADYPDLDSVVEDQLTTAQPTDTYIFAWDGVSPIRATLCWTDPAGNSNSAHDERTPDLVNNLNLKLIAPNGTEYFPFVMPFVGTWTVASMSQNATTGVNNVDNVEQVDVASPGQAGAWQAVVSYAGNLTNGSQNYGLIISGAGTAGNLAFNPSSYSVTENGGLATISVARLGGTTGACSVNYSTSNGTAIAGSDYTATSGTLSWNSGEGGSKSFNIPILNDGTSESYSETLSITLSNATGITIAGTNPATLTILDDETTMGVTSFNNGGTFAAGSQQNITWASSLGGNVRIELLKNGILYTTIASSTANDGLFSWTIPSLVPTGSDYSIRITTLAGGGESDVSDGTFSINNQVSGTIYSANMSTNPGWTLQGAWAYGVPAGLSGDPSAGKTGTNVIGYNLNGHYTNNLDATYATTPAIDCSGYTNVQLSFQRWLGVEASIYDNASIQVSNNGTAWTTIWEHSGSDLIDTSWKSMTYDISAVADGRPSVYIRWTMGTTDGSVTFCGWNIDDVVVSGMGNAVNPAGEVAFSSANFQVSENADTATITVNRTRGTSGAISVNYNTSNGTASAGSDYTASSGTLSWANGDSSARTFTVPILNDSTREDFLESVNLTLTNTVGGTIVGTNPATLTIQDDDNQPPVVNAGNDQLTTLQPVTIVPGLYYGTVAGNINLTTPNPNTTILVNVASQTENTIAGNTTEIYTGSIYDADGQISFTEHIDDKARIWIDGILVLSNDTWNARTSTGNLNLTPGWHDIEIRISNGSGGSGPVASPGIGYDPAGGTAWRTLVDPGDGSLLRTEQALPWAQVNLDGTASDSDSDPLAITWSLVSGPAAVTFGNASLVDTTATFTQEGVYTLRLTADDGRDPRSDNVVVTVASYGLELNIESASMPENGGTSNATLTRPGILGNLVVSLISSNTSEATVPATVTIPEGQTSATFVVTAQDDAIADGTQGVTITASAAGNPNASDTINVTDNEVATLTLNIAAASVNESAGAGATTATVTRNSLTAGAMVVNLSSNDTSEATVPSTVTIAAGQVTSPAFNINAVDDSVLDDTQTVTITASFAGHTSGTDTLDVTDDVPYTLTVITGSGGASTTGGGLKDPDASPHAISATASTGYQFANWTVTSGSGTVDNPNSANTVVSATSDTTVQANFQIITYSVSYNGNANTGGTAPGNQTKTYGLDLTLLGPGDLLRTGYTFSGWNTQANGSGTSYPAGGTYSANANLILHAQWTPDTYTITYDGNGSTIGTAPGNQTKTHDVNLTLATNTGNLIRSGFSFAGWNTAADGSGTDYAVAGIYTGNTALTLYAKWVAGSDGTWVQTTAGPFNWGTIENWTGNTVASGADCTAFFTPNINPNQTVNMEASRVIGNITFTDSTTNSHNLTISGSGILTLARTSGAPLVDVTQSTRTLTISSSISGSTGLQKNGPGTLILSGTNNYTGGTSISAGTLRFGTRASMPTSGTVTVADGAVLGVAVAGTATTWGGGTGLAGVAGLTSTANNGNGFGGQSGTTVDFNGNSFLNLDVTANVIESNPIGNGSATSIGLIKSGSSTFTPSVSNSYTGTTTILAGTLSVASLPDAGNNSPIGAFASAGAGGLVLQGGTFSYTGATASTNRGFTLNAGSTVNVSTAGAALTMGDFAVSGNQTLTTSGGSTSSLALGSTTLTSNLTVTANITTSLGTVTLSGANRNLDGSGTGSLSVASINNGGFNLTIGGSGANNQVTGTISGAGSLSKAGTATWTLSGSNSYTGTTSVSSGGALVFNSIANVGGGNSALGAPVTIANGTIALATTLRYNGSGHSSNRVINLNSAAPVLDMSGTGTLTFTSNLTATNASAKTLTLTGSTTGIGELAGAIVNNSTTNTTAIAKTGTGIWVLSGPNTYTGTTSVSVGKLFINGNQTNATGNVSVAADATLGGRGTIGGNTTIADGGRLEFNLATSAASHDKLELATGKALTFSGASVLTITTTGVVYPGTYVLLTAPGGINGSVPATVNLPAGWSATVSKSGNDLVLNVTATPPGPIDHFAISGVPDETVIGTTLTGITLTAQDFGNQTVTSFNGTVSFGGTAGITGTSANFTAGVLTGVSVTPTLAGTARTFTVDDGSGHTGTATFDVRSLYDAWSGGAAMDVDSNGDGVPNGLAWALGAADPNADAGDLLPTMEPAAEPGFVTFTYRRADAAHTAPGTTIRVEHGSTLTGWQTAVHDGNDIIISETDDGYGPGIDKVQVSIREAIAPDGRLFLQLKVGRTSP